MWLTNKSRNIKILTKMVISKNTIFLIWPQENIKGTVTRRQLWTECLCPLKIHVLKAKSSLWCYLELELTPHGWISDLLRRDAGKMISFSLISAKWGRDEKTAIRTWGSRVLTRPWPGRCSDWIPKPPELWEVNVCCLICYSSLNRLTEVE